MTTVYDIVRFMESIAPQSKRKAGTMLDCCAGEGTSK